MCEKFTKRELRIKSTPQLQVIGNLGLVIFDWEFHAITRIESTKIVTHGRESQIYTKFDNYWKLFHVHYSQLQ